MIPCTVGSNPTTPATSNTNKAQYLLALIQKYSLPSSGTVWLQIVFDNIREHSRKPDCVRDRIVELCGDVPRIELFARQRHEGWDAWGNEI